MSKKKLSFAKKTKLAINTGIDVLFRFLVKATVSMGRAVITVASIATIAVMTPKIHSLLIRNYVGSKVVMVTNHNPNWLQPGQRFGGGTGYHVKAPSGKTFIMTNRHVCDIVKGDDLFVTTGSGASYAKKIIQRDPDTDLCLIEPISDTEGLSLAEKPLTYGQDVSALGHPSLQPLTQTKGEVVGPEVVVIGIGIVGREITREECLKYSNRGIDKYVLKFEVRSLFSISKKFKMPSSEEISVEVCKETVQSKVTTVPIWHGSSGSPAVDFWGNVVGTMFAIGAEGFWGRFVPAEDIKEFLKER